MAYSDFSLAKAKNDFALTLEESRNLFSDVKPVLPSETLKTLLRDYIPLATAISTEKARSEFLIAPILAELRRLLHNKISLFSGNEFNVEPTRGLQGYCDYIISGSKEQLYITAPVTIIFEAKKEDIIGGLGQCVAAMVAAQLFNQKKGNEVESIYGSVTTGTNWKFLILQQSTVYIDEIEYYIKEVDKILGILLQPFQPALSAV
ncbi:hypothetical protein G7B40_027650 [Aetokthonos hydrillicola Thurmond2011]|jgi:hypothetical protein|uniref:Uncharacterized protein n=1 Tax=Aetokthonos hydrillicola Thurmond2011 TaxID=2712845 RepID=A0AAP5MBS7_9CYAN|nr:hypothetical protein [Aetokthonos hydrillicola]MBO3459201.1 hypothetical protein [Aetokthonos hydrillicola CCALA 1050]MBW4584160.1 hypothetical protein [Aetokthonos hydrillicola CCALA 1050]MDR9898307.1 hypothetical protein [Aetokthonos hydrillicola Thurmond2011]